MAGNPPRRAARSQSLPPLAPPIPHRRYPQWPLLPIAFRYVLPLYRLRSISACLQVGLYPFEKPHHSLLLDGSQRGFIHACRSLCCCAPASTPSTERHFCRSGHTARGIAVSCSAWHTSIAGSGVVVLYQWGFWPFPACPRTYPHIQARSKQGPFPPARFAARLHRYYGPLGLPPGSARFQPSGLMRPVFARLGCQVGSLQFRIALSQRASACDPEEVQHSFLSGMRSVAFAAT